MTLYPRLMASKKVTSFSIPVKFLPNLRVAIPVVPEPANNPIQYHPHYSDILSAIPSLQQVSVLDGFFHRLLLSYDPQ